MVAGPCPHNHKRIRASAPAAAVVGWFESRINNGVLEGINSLIQAAKTKARGYRSIKNLITIVYLIAGKLDLSLSHTQ
jgi:hypothetical protein